MANARKVSRGVLYVGATLHSMWRPASVHVRCRVGSHREDRDVCMPRHPYDGIGWSVYASEDSDLTSMPHEVSWDPGAGHVIDARECMTMATTLRRANAAIARERDRMVKVAPISATGEDWIWWAHRALRIAEIRVHRDVWERLGAQVRRETDRDGWATMPVGALAPMLATYARTWREARESECGLRPRALP